MNFLQIINEAWNSLNSNRMRSILTTLGIIIGVAAVIAMIAIGTGAQDTILNQISGIGTNLLFVFEGNEENDSVTVSPLTMQDANAIGEAFAAPHIAERGLMVEQDGAHHIAPPIRFKQEQPWTPAAAPELGGDG